MSRFFMKSITYAARVISPITITSELLPDGCSKFSCIAQEANFQRRLGGASGRDRRTSSTQESAPVRRLRTDAPLGRRSGADYFH